MNDLHEELLDQILKHLNIFDKARLSFANRYFNRFIYDTSLQKQIYDYFSERAQNYACCLRIVRRINTDGVVRGECLQCRADNLLYTRFDGFNETTVCLESCRFACQECGHVTHGRVQPIRCVSCNNMYVSNRSRMIWV